MKIVGLTSQRSDNHDNSVALLIDGELIFAEAQERASRIKHDRSFPALALNHALSFSNLKLKDIDYFACGLPSLTLNKGLLQYLYGARYSGPKNFARWIFTRTAYLSSGMERRNKSNPDNYIEANLPLEKLIFVSHHLAHAETAYSFSGFEKCLVVAWDGYGIEKNGKPLAGAVYLGENGNLKKVEEVPFYASMGLYYAAVTLALGFKVNDGEGKTMGLASYGDSRKCYKEMKAFCPYFDNGKWVSKNSWLEVNSVSRPQYFKTTDSYLYLESLVEKYSDQDVAAAIQRVLEEEGVKFIKYLTKKYNEKRVAAAGGVFLNVKMNLKLLEEKIVDDLFIYPDPTDGGVSVGAAIAVFKEKGGVMPIKRLERVDFGCGFNQTQIKDALNKFKKEIKSKKVAKKDIGKIVAGKLKNGVVIGWFQGRGEHGPRALGRRSVLSDPRHGEAKDRINSKLKQRDWFMPFAPAFMHDKSDKYLVNNWESPFMIIADRVRRDKQKEIEAVVHVDGTARPQRVKKEIIPAYYDVIEQFYKLTGIPVILDTSFNRHGLPMVHSPEEAIEHLLWGCIDELVLENYIVTRK